MATYGQRLEAEAREMSDRRVRILRAREIRNRHLSGREAQRAVAVDNIIDAANLRARQLREERDGADRRS